MKPIAAIKMSALFVMLMTLLFGCQEKENTGKGQDLQPELRLESTLYKVAAQSGQCEIPYTLQHPAQDCQLVVQTSAEWVTSTEVQQDKVLVKVAENSGRVPRSTVLTLSYGELTAEVNLLQFEMTRRYDVFPMYANEDIPYRIPAVAVTKSGTVLAVADYRHSRADIGVVNNGRIDLHMNRSFDDGVTWEGVSTIIEGQGAASSDFMNVGYGDPCIVADRESDRVLMLSCAGNVSYPNGTRDNHQNIARFYSEDGGLTWGKPDDIAESIYSQFDDCSQGPAQAMFVASGKILQSRFVKTGDYYRLYCAVLLRNKNGVPTNYVLYSDDFGGVWRVLGDPDRPAVRNTCDEPKVEELPDGSVLISSRWEGGRYYNIYNFSNPETAAGTWQQAAFSGKPNGGVEAQANSTNGEILSVPAIRMADGQKVDLLLQSVPLGPGRKNVGIYYKALEQASDYASPKAIARDWEGVYQVTYLNSAYSTMVQQHDGRIAFLWEETTYCSDGGGYTIAYDCYALERITSGKYSLSVE